jgi:hypothetical protein
MRLTRDSLPPRAESTAAACCTPHGAGKKGKVAQRLGQHMAIIWRRCGVGEGAQCRLCYP